MPPDANLADEEGRLRSLNRLDVLDTAMEEPFERIVDLVRQVLSVPMSAVSLVDRHRQWFKARRGLDCSETARDVSFCSHAIAAPGPFIVDDALRDPRFSSNPLVLSDPFIRSYAGVPLTMPDGYSVGTLCAIDTRPRSFSATEIGMLANFAAIVVSELQLREIADTDALTGALSRRAWMDRARQELSRSHRYGRPVCVAILDLDHFKAINDRFGHPEGDRVIQSLARVCRTELRASDLFGRLGGEEFGVFLPETEGAEALTVLDRVRATFAGVGPDREPRTAAATVSIGLADQEAAPSDLDALIAAADQALYDAKRAGRNTVVRAPARHFATT